MSCHSCTFISALAPAAAAAAATGIQMDATRPLLQCTGASNNDQPANELMWSLNNNSHAPDAPAWIQQLRGRCNIAGRCRREIKERTSTIWTARRTDPTRPSARPSQLLWPEIQITISPNMNMNINIIVVCFQQSVS